MAGGHERKMPFQRYFCRSFSFRLFTLRLTIYLTLQQKMIETKWIRNRNLSETIKWKRYLSPCLSLWLCVCNPKRISHHSFFQLRSFKSYTCNNVHVQREWARMTCEWRRHAVAACTWCECAATNFYFNLKFLNSEWLSSVWQPWIKRLYHSRCTQSQVPTNGRPIQ